MSVNAVSGARDTYSFISSGHNYGKIQLATYDGAIAYLEANGIQAGSGAAAPDSGYLSGTVCSAQSIGQSYFIRTGDTQNYFGKITVTSYTVAGKAQTLTVQFNWVVQTTAGDHSLQ